MKISSSNMSALNSGEHLVNFINNASTSVKTVLSKPGCFKRNTNHRRFLQKQLRQNAQDAIIRTKAETIATTTTTKKNILSNNNERTDSQPLSPKLNNTNNNNNNNNIKKATTKREKTIRKKRRYNPIRLSPQPPSTLPQLQVPPTTPSSAPLLIPSPMAVDFMMSDTQHYNNSEMLLMDSFYQTSPPSRTYVARHNFFPNIPGNQSQFHPSMYEQTAPADYSAMTPANHHHLESNFVTMPNITRKNSSSSSLSTTSSYTSEEDFGFSDFLSGEDLMQSLEFGDLFIPDQRGNTGFTNSENKTLQNELAYRAYLESERQIQYLAHLEAIEACYQSRENELFDNTF